MALIFYDLETSDKDPCGQILNYSFIRTNNDFEIVDELTGDINLSVLQIPSPEALLTNRVRIKDHQAKSFPSEPESMQRIANFISNSIVVAKEQVFLLGYNSARFDLPFLRTSFIRNGVNPYFSGKIKYCDLLHLVKKAYLCQPDFPFSQNKLDPKKLSLSLESVSKAFGLLEVDQSHHSREDVLLTIKLAKRLNDTYKLHPSSFNSYEAKKGDEIIAVCTPNYDRESENSDSTTQKTLGLLNESHRAALWLDIAKYSEGKGREAVYWYNKNGGQLTRTEGQMDLASSKPILDSAKLEFSNLTTENFFPKSSCDIDQDIYRLDMQKIGVLGQIIWNNDRKNLDQIKDKDLQALVLRYWLAYGMRHESRGEKWKAKLEQYANYRYTEKSFQLVKVLGEPSQDADKINNAYHRSLGEIESSLEALLRERTDKEDQEILLQLKDYISTSEMKKSLCEPNSASTLSRNENSVTLGMFTAQTSNAEVIATTNLSPSALSPNNSSK